MSDPNPRRRRRRAAIVLAGAPLLVVLMSVVSFAMTRVVETRDERPSPVVPTPGRDGFTLTGTVTAPVRPGASAPVDVEVDNHRDTVVVLWDVVVTVTSIDAPHASATAPCTVGDFRVTQMSEPVAVASRGSVSLSGLGWDETRWPQLGMVDAPRDQAGCIDADLTLTYSARGMAPA